VIAILTGGSRPAVVDSRQVVPPDTVYKPARFVGMPAPDFTIKTAAGSTFHLSDWRGHVVFLNFWATWCTPCQLEMPAFQQVIDGQIPGKAIIFAVDSDPIETANDINQFEASLGVHIPAGMDSDGAVSNLYQIIPKPHTFVIDADGVIRYDQLGAMTPEMIRAYLAKLDPAYF
jgi:peroxiredoxin